MQKSHVDWLRLGDKNTKYFHTSTTVQKGRNKIEALQNEAGAWINGSEGLKNMAVQYYKELSSSDVAAGSDFITSSFLNFDISTKEELSK